MRRRRARKRPSLKPPPLDVKDAAKLLLKCLPPEVRISPRIVRRYLAKVTAPNPGVKGQHLGPHTLGR